MATIDLTNENFKQTLADGRTVLVEVFAPLCGHCRAFTPVFKKVSESHNDVAFGMLNVEEQRELVNEHGVHGVSTIIAFRDGAGVLRKVDRMSEEALVHFMEEAKGADASG